MRCTATTRAGKPCRRAALSGEERCHAHSGAKVGRPEKLTAEVKRRIVEAVRVGNTVEVAAAYAGISRSTLHRWLSHEKTDPRYAALRTEVLKAEAEAEFYAVAIIRRAMPEDWRAALAFLERRRPARWRQHDRAYGPEQPSEIHGGEVIPAALLRDPDGRKLVAELRDRLARARAAQSG
jgi:transposase-like protein